jgi:hypothetical protein
MFFTEVDRLQYRWRCTSITPLNHASMYNANFEQNTNLNVINLDKAPTLDQFEHNVIVSNAQKLSNSSIADFHKLQNIEQPPNGVHQLVSC